MNHREKCHSVAAYLDSKLGLDTSREQADIQYNVAVSQTCGAGSVPAMPTPTPLAAVRLPVWGDRGDREAWALHVECIMPGRSASFVLRV